MKKIISEVMIILLMLSACQKEPEWKEVSTNPEPFPVKTVSHNRTHDALAKVLALALTDRQVRLFLHSEIARQFTGDFDILYDLIKDRKIESEEYGSVSFSELLENKAREAGVDFSLLENGSSGYKNLQISSPVYFENWNPDTYVPVVISLPVDYQEGEGRKVNAYGSNGVETMISEDDIKDPFLLVRQAERVDADGFMRVDPDGFVIPEEEKFFSAKEVYEMSERSLKSADAVPRESVIEVLDEEAFQQMLKSKRSLRTDGSVPKDKPTPVTEPGLKSANAVSVDAPGNFRVNPAGPYTIQISWSQVAGAVGYEIYRQYDTWPNYLLATVGQDQINYYDQGLTNGEHYIYSVRAVDASGNTSPLTGGLESYASWRTNGNRDIVDKIYISSECWNWCCGLFDGKIELQYKTSYLLTPGNTIICYPGGSSLNNLGQKTSSQQKGKWCTYTHYLFPWDVRNNSYSYQFKLIEDDGAGDGKTIKLSTTFKVQLSKIVDVSATPAIEFKVANGDEEFGEVIIQYWELKCGPDSNSDGYNIMPKNGHARMYLRQ